MSFKAYDSVAPFFDCVFYSRCKSEPIMCSLLDLHVNGRDYNPEDVRMPTEKLYRKNYE